VRVKVCGVTRLEDALACAGLGVDLLGFNFWPGSKRHVAPEAARDIVSRLPPGVRAVGLFVNQDRAHILEVSARVGLHAVQLHGDESPSDCEGLGLPVARALAVRERPDVAALRAWPVAALVLDAPVAGYGGGGRTFPWEHAAGLAAALQGRPEVWLAGGLTPDNVAAAVRAVRPDVVDVASGVESAPGLKDFDKLARFVAAAREAAP
jgi:phosphoribosylanthranilate isomerase